jgi:hypothetical protein
MRELIVSTFLTLDGPCRPRVDLERTIAVASRCAWSVNYWRRTYEVFSANWPHAPEEADAKPLNDATKYVASRSHPTLEW